MERASVKFIGKPEAGSRGPKGLFVCTELVFQFAVCKQVKIRKTQRDGSRDM